MKEKAERWAENFTNIIEGWLAFGKTAKKQKLVDEVKTKLDALLSK